MNWLIDQKKVKDELSNLLLFGEAGKITKSIGLVYEAYLPGASVGSICKIKNSTTSDEDAGVEAEVIGFKDRRVLLMPFELGPGINNESLVILKNKRSTVKVGSALLGRVIDARGVPIDGKGPISFGFGGGEDRSLYEKPSHPLKRAIIREPLDLGIRSINTLLTCGKGQRLGIMAGSGVGKSVLLGMMAKNTNADVNVIALIGERGREVREFIERELGPEGLKKSVVVVATSDMSPLLRMRGAFLAMTIAEHFRDRGDDVLCLMDSVTRFCMAQREIGLAMGEPPASKGYTPSVFSTLPKLLERAGTAPNHGSITGLFTVLVEGDELDEPIADATRSILDGHVVLSRKLAERNQYPAIDVLQSTSRVMNAVVTQEHQKMAAEIREWMAVYQASEDLITIGAYAKGTNAAIDQAIFAHEKIQKLLRQPIDQRATFADSVAQMTSVTRAVNSYLESLQSADAAKNQGSSNTAKPALRF